MDTKVRFAPSPTGIPHVGNIRTALFNYFFAKSSGGSFILRIEDTDQARKLDSALEAIQESLKWLGADWDDFIVQSDRLEEYRKHAEQLVSRNLAKVEDGAIRFIVPEEGSTLWADKVGNKKIEFQNREIEDFIILKSDGYPTYHLANVIDDHEEGITHVIRGEDWIPSTPKHIMLYKAFGWEDTIPEFAHVPNVLGTDGKKLSKRKGAKSVLDFREEGYLPEALLNYLMLLGWSPKDDREVMPRDEIIKEFKIENINTSPAAFDQKKLDWMNGVYIREKLTEEEFKTRLKNFYKTEKDLDDFIENNEILKLARTRMTTLSDFRVLVRHNRTEDLNHKVAEDLLQGLKDLKEWRKEEIFKILKGSMDKYNVKMPVLYKIFTGREQGLPLPDFLEALGRLASIRRVKNE